MTGTIPLRARHQQVEPVFTVSFTVWCVAMVILSAAAGIVLGLALSGT